jgi:hypothetical protein
MHTWGSCLLGMSPENLYIVQLSPGVRLLTVTLNDASVYRSSTSSSPGSCQGCRRVFDSSSSSTPRQDRSGREDKTGKTHRMFSKSSSASAPHCPVRCDRRKRVQIRSAPSNCETPPLPYSRIEGRDSPLRQAVRSSQVKSTTGPLSSHVKSTKGT